MGRYLKSACKMSRRIGFDLSLKGLGRRDIVSKCKLKTCPGQHGNKKRRSNGNYAIQLHAKQAIKYTYGIFEAQLKRFYRIVKKKRGSKGELLLQLIESRLDNIVYRMGFGLTRAESRQLVSHKSVVLIRGTTINRVISIPSFFVKPGDVIKIKNTSIGQNRIKYSLRCAEKLGFVKWVNINIDSMVGTFLRMPKREELSDKISEQLIIEFYSK